MSGTSLERLTKIAKLMDSAVETHYNTTLEPNHYMVDIKYLEIKRGCILEGPCGRGNTIEQAAEDYLRQIRGQHLVVRAMSETSRKEFLGLPI